MDDSVQYEVDAKQHSCSQHVYNESILALSRVSRVTLSHMYMSGRVESSSQCIRSYLELHKTQSILLVMFTLAPCWISFLTAPMHTPFPSCQNEGCFLILYRVHNKGSCRTTFVLHVSYFALHHPIDLLALHHSIGIAYSALIMSVVHGAM